MHQMAFDLSCGAALRVDVVRDRSERDDVFPLLGIVNDTGASHHGQTSPHIVE
jgi:hypothetical protein